MGTGLSDRFAQQPALRRMAALVAGGAVEEACTWELTALTSSGEGDERHRPKARA
jgi:hypothetical protein